MNETLRVLKERRSIRKFEPDQLKAEVLEAIIEAGIFAPSAHNEQAWHFTVIQNAELLKEMNLETKEAAKAIPDDFIQKMANDAEFNIFYDAPTVIVVSGRNDARLAQVDCAAATENMLIAAESVDIGTCWIGLVGILFNSEKGEEYRQRLHIPDGYSPYHAVAFGYKGIKVNKVPPRKQDVVNYIK